MNKADILKLLPLILVMIAVTLGFCACSADNSSDPVVIEPGVTGDTPTDGSTADTSGTDTQTADFIDKGENSTVDDLIANQQKITSYYFEQTIPYTDATVFLQVWYYDNKMKVISSESGYILTENYYDYDKLTMVSYSPADSDKAMQMTFDPAGEDAPGNPVREDYSTYILLGSEEVDRQFCLILQTTAGDKLWISSKYGFPLQVEFVDQMGNKYTVAYRNLEINTVTASDVEVPADLPIYTLNAGE
jgi:hypothetical protein